MSKQINPDPEYLAKYLKRLKPAPPDNERLQEVYTRVYQAQPIDGEAIQDGLLELTQIVTRIEKRLAVIEEGMAEGLSRI